MSGDIQPSLVVTTVQHTIEWMHPEANREQLWQQASKWPKSDIIVLPETFTTGFGRGMEQLAEPPMGTTLEWMKQMAKQTAALMVGTWTVKEGERCYNRMHLVAPDGTFCTYDKAHTFRVSGEADIVARGQQRQVMEWHGWRIRPAVCYDLRFPTWLRNNVRRQAETARGEVALDYDLMVVCANWPASRIAAWTTLLKARAIENLCYVVGCNRMGADTAGSNYNGQSLTVDYKGAALAAADESPFVSTTIALQPLQHFRQKWPFYLDFD